MRRRGKVWLVGAGPGDPGLLTLRGAEVLRGADAVLYDALVDRSLLDLVPEHALRIDAGKRGHSDRNLLQDDITRRLVDLAREGKQVVRLKGGDPFVFGRGGEEASACVAAGVDFEVVPGVSAAIAAPAYAGIPVTDRRHSASVAIVTGHKDPLSGAAPVRWPEIAVGAETLVVLMGLRSLETWVAEILSSGRSPATPAAVIASATTPRQSVVSAPLGELVARVREAGLEPPATIVVGEVVRLREEIAWYERLPLFGRRVLVTRAKEQATAMIHSLRTAGAEPVALAVIRIAACEKTPALDRALAELDAIDAVLLTSANAARLLAARAAALGIELGSAACRFLVVGPMTERAARQAGLRIDPLACRRWDAEGLLEALREERPVAGLRFLLPRSTAARETLAEGLRAGGARVDAVDLYRPVPVPFDAAAIGDEIRSGGFDALTFTSPSTVRHFFGPLDTGSREAASRLVVAAIGPSTAAALREEGVAPTVVASSATAEALVDSLAEHFAKPGGS